MGRSARWGCPTLYSKLSCLCCSSWATLPSLPASEHHLEDNNHSILSAQEPVLGSHEVQRIRRKSLGSEARRHITEPERGDDTTVRRYLRPRRQTAEAGVEEQPAAAPVQYSPQETPTPPI